MKEIIVLPKASGTEWYFIPMMRMNFMRLLEIVQTIIFQLLGTDSCLSVGNMLKMKEYDHVRISFNNGRRKATYLRLEI